MPYRDTAEYRRKAKECVLRAKATDDVLLKTHLLELADTWKGLAQRAERVARMAAISAKSRQLEIRGVCTAAFMVEADPLAFVQH
jgi:hypothetical protein